MKTLSFYLYSCCLLSTSLFNCNQPTNGNTERSLSKRKAELTIPYHLNKGSKMLMPQELEEISGITFLQGNDLDIYAIQDEKGQLFKYNWKSKQTTSTRFGKDGDYEDLTVNQSHFFVLKSNGHIYTFPIKGALVTLIQKDLLPKGEYESIAIDQKTKLIYVLCKECQVDRKRKQTSGYIFSADQNGLLTHAGGFKIDLSELNALNPKLRNTFRPSALVKNNLTDEWYIISSVNKVLVVTDHQFHVKSVEQLDKNQFPQPEGIAFDSNNNLYISSEAGNQDKGIIYKFEK